MNNQIVSIKNILALFLSLHLFLITGCVSNDVVKNGTGEGVRVIYMYKTPCYGNTCASYELELLDNRTMYLIPREMMSFEGRYKRILSEAEYKQLVNAFINVDFFKFEKEYMSSTLDLPTTYLSFSYKGNELKVKDYAGGPEELTELEYMMMSFLDRVGWEKDVE